ncbi:mediator of RNA polymerase II transcription subunit 8-B-like [Oppia nitens]|uniref:mediator of RNA polymerase II transcription subunit 8-B-like n=1 Tax=Oppia nitens TaxID=1686743 RepID=UPI0023DB213C|nr:mediator of RNA polymerase II transcription subunit 8-B-like [Oppia nitens]
MTDREEKQLEAVVDHLIAQVTDLKTSLQHLIMRVESEYESISWPQLMDSFVALSGRINNLQKLIKNDKMPTLRNRVLFPMLLNPDLDPELAKLTEGRVQSFNHDMVPDYLRTKPEPEIEAKENAILSKAFNLNSDQSHKQITSANKIVTNITEMIKNNREEWETETNRQNQTQTCLMTDTSTLLAAITFGKGLKTMSPPIKGPANAGMSSVPQTQPSQRPPGKAPATIKTNIKAANNVHPYTR